MIDLNKQTKKLIAPVIITLIIIAYAIFYLIAATCINVLFVIFPIVIIVLSIYMLAERIKEIEDGEDDDLSKY